MNRSDLTKIQTAVSSKEKGKKVSVTTNTLVVSTQKSKEKAIVSTDVIKSSGPSERIVTRDHSKLANLDFEHSGHTGFAGIKFGTTAE
jgi:hypothetical protein